MAEVSRVTATGLSSVSSKKLPNGSSSKHIYDGVFSSQPQNNLKSSEFSCFNDDDYAEIFGSSKFDNGPWQSSYSSIPVLELPEPEQRSRGTRGRGRGRGIDYSGVFGGGEDEGLAVPDGEELFDQLKKKTKTSSVPILRSNGHTNEATGAPGSCRAQNGQSPTNGFCTSFESLKHVQQQNNEIPANDVKKKKNVVHVHSIPGSTFSLHEVGSSQKTRTSSIPVIKADTELGIELCLAKKVNFSGHSSLDLGEVEQKSDLVSGFLKASGLNESNSAAISHATLQPTDETKSATHVDDIHAIPGCTYSLHEVGYSQKTQTSTTPVIKADTEFGMDNNLEKKGNHSSNTSSDLVADEEKNERDVGFQKASDLSESSSAAASLGALQPSDETIGATHVAGAHAIPGSTYLLHEVSPLKTQTGRTPVIKADTELGMDIGLEKKGQRSGNTSSDLVANEEKNEHDAGFRKAPGSSESNSSATSLATHQHSTIAGISKMMMNNAEMDFNVTDKNKADGSSVFGVHKQNSEDDAASLKESGSSMPTSVATPRDTCQTSSISRSSDVIKDDAMSTSVATSCDTCLTSSISRSSNVIKDDAEVATAFDLGKKQRRHFRMTSLDLGDYRQARERDTRFQRSSRSHGSCSFDASHDRFGAHITVQPSKSSENSLHRGGGGSPPSLDEQLDINSAAAVSAAALQRALKEAEMRIRLAKEFLEQESPGSTKLRFKDTLKTKIMKEEKQENEINEFGQRMMHANYGRVDDVKRACSHSEKKSVLETAQFEPVLEDQKIFLKSDEPIIGENAKASKFIEEGDKRGGEWHLNQLITGVKNRIASFMTWQAEKKEEPKEVEASRKWPQQSEKKEEPKEVKETEKNQSAATFAGETMLEEDKLGLIPEVKGLKENDSTRSNIMNQETAGDKVDLIPETEGPTRTNFLFFSFNSERSWNHPHPEELEKKTEESWKLGIDARQEEMMYEAKNECTQGKGNEENQEGLDDICMTQDCGKILEEIDEMEEELHSVASHDRIEFSFEEDDNRSLNEDHGDDRSELTHEEGDNSSVNEECGNDSSANGECRNDSSVNEEFGNNSSVNKECGDDKINFTCEEVNERRVNEECGNNSRVDEECRDDRIESTCEGDNDRTMNDECGDYRSQLTDEMDIDRMVNEEHGDDRNKLTHEEDDERAVNVECKDDGSKFTDEEEIRRLNVNHEEEPINNFHFPENNVEIIEKEDEWDECRVVKKTEEHQDNSHLEEMSLVGETGKRAETTREGCGWQEYEGILGSIDHVEDKSGRMNGLEEDKSYERQCNHTDRTEKEVAVQAGCIAADDECRQTENIVFSKTEEAASGIAGCNPGVEEAVFPDGDSHIVLEISDYSSEPEMDIETSALLDEEGEKKTEIINPSSEPKMDIENPVFAQLESDWIEEEREVTSFSIENIGDSGGVEYVDGTDGALPCENFVLHDCETDLNCEPKDTDLKSMESKSEETNHLIESGKTLNVEEAASVGDQEGEKGSVEGVHRRRRWFENGERPSILEDNIANFEMEQEVEESDLVGTVQIHADELESETKEYITAGGADITSNQEDIQANVEANHKRRRWFVSRGEEGVPEPPSLFAGLKVASGMNHEAVNVLPHHNVSDGSIDRLNTESGDTLHVADASDVSEEIGKQNVEASPRRKRWFESGEKMEPAQQLRTSVDSGTTVAIDQEHKLSGDLENGKLGNVPILEGKDDVHDKVEVVNELHGDLDAVKRRKNEKQKERIAVERAIREARERAFSEARERARRDAADRPNFEACQTTGSWAEDVLGKISAEEIYPSDMGSMEAKIRAERAAEERATIEARERALQNALSEKASQKSREKAGKHPYERSSSLDPKYHNSSSYSRCSDYLNNDEKFDGADGESVQRCKARSERQNQTMERAAKTHEEKNKHDLVAQKEEAATNMFADALDAEYRRWSCGKEGNLRALLSTLHYILGSDSGWQAVSLTDLVAPTAVRKAYKKATLCVHPDKLQQRGATIQQKYVCEKVFDLLKDAWSNFNPDEC